MTNKQPWIIAYDITDHRQRTYLHQLLKGFGEALQKSVFLCHLDARRKARLETMLARINLEHGDRLEFFRISDVQSLSPAAQPVRLDDTAFVIME